METEDLLDTEQDYKEFARGIKQKTGLDLLLYKQPQVRRRLTSLKDRKGYRTFREFLHAINMNATVYREFMDQLTINVTEFYRNQERWSALERTVLPDILSRTKTIKCWSAACSTGEEPYSLVMTIGKQTSLQNISVHATDIDDTVLARAKEGRYPSRSLAGIPAEDLQRYFKDEGGEHVISDDIKRHVHFRQHNLLSDRFESGYDLIVCRNVLIYFTEEAKATVFRKFSEALKPGGYLFVGATEQILGAEKFGFVSPSMFFYKRV